MFRSATFFALFTFFAACSFATIHEVEVGGIGQSSSNPPYFNPQNITILQGDTVRWTWVTSTHNVTSTSGPVSFSSGDHGTGFVFVVPFNTPGTYDYECSLFNHANTQFGTVTVDPAVGFGNALSQELSISPVPMQDQVNLRLPENGMDSQIQLIEPASGRVLLNQVLPAGQSQLSVGNLPKGIYLMVVQQGEAVLRQSVLKQ